MSHLSELYYEKRREEQQIMNTWADFDMKEELLQSMEDQVKSDEWKELKDEH